MIWLFPPLAVSATVMFNCTKSVSHLKHQVFLSLRIKEQELTFCTNVPPSRRGNLILERPISFSLHGAECSSVSYTGPGSFYALLLLLFHHTVKLFYDHLWIESSQLICFLGKLLKNILANVIAAWSRNRWDSLRDKRYIRKSEKELLEHLWILQCFIKMIQQMSLHAFITISVRFCYML